MVASWFLSETGPAAILLAAFGLSEMRMNLLESYEWRQKLVVNINCVNVKPTESILHLRTLLPLHS